MKNIKDWPLASEDLIALITALLGIIVMWFLPANINLKLACYILCAGIIFDLLSSFYHVMTIITGKYMSGFPVVGLLFYMLFIVSAKFSLSGWHKTSHTSILIYKVIDALVLLAFHSCCQLPIRFQKSREPYQ